MNLDEPKGESKAPVLIFFGGPNKNNGITQSTTQTTHTGTTQVSDNSKNNSVASLPFFDDFNQGASRWIVPAGASAKNGHVVWHAGTDVKSLQLKSAIPMENIVVEFDGYAESNEIGVHITDKNNIGYVYILGGWFNTKSGFDIGGNAENRQLVAGKVFIPRKWQHYKIVRSGDLLEAFCDGRRIFKRTSSKHFGGYGYLKFDTWNAVIGIDNIRIYRVAATLQTQRPNHREPITTSAAPGAGSTAKPSGSTETAQADPPGGTGGDGV